MRGALLLVVVLGVLHSSTAFDWKPCSNSSEYADIKEVTLTPEEPAAGDTVNFAIKGTASAMQLSSKCRVLELQPLSDAHQSLARKDVCSRGVTMAGCCNHHCICRHSSLACGQHSL